MSQTAPCTATEATQFDFWIGDWDLTWEGNYLDFVGAFQDGEMILTRETTSPDGTPLHQRMVFTHIEDDSLDWSWERSDDGRSWEPLWQIHYERK